MSRFTVDAPRHGLALIQGPVPMSQLAALLKTYPRDYVMSTKFGELLPGVMVMGTPAAVEDYYQELVNGKAGERLMAEFMVHPVVTQDLAKWFVAGDVGASSKSIVYLITGFAGLNAKGQFSTNTPHDLFDFRRCVLLLEQVPSLKQGMVKVAEHNQEWRALVSVWNSLVAQLDAELPEWRTANKLSGCKLSRAMLDEAKKKGRDAMNKASAKEEVGHEE